MISLPPASILPISLYTLSVIIASLLFYFSYKVLSLFRLPPDSGYTQALLRSEQSQLIRYETVHMGLILLYLSGIAGCMFLSLASEQSFELTLSQLGLSIIMVLYPIVDMRRIIGKKKIQIENAWVKKNIEIFEDSMRFVEGKYAGDVVRHDWRESFRDFPVFPVDQLEVFVAEYNEDVKLIMAHAWIKEKENLVNEYKQFRQNSSYCKEAEKEKK